MSSENIQEALDEMKLIHNNIRNFIEEEEGIDENFKNLIKFLNNHNVEKDLHKFKLFLLLLSRIINNHKRDTNFFIKIEKIIDFYKDEIKNKFTNHQIFKIFKKDKKILLYLIEHQLITIDKYITDKMTTDKYKKLKYHEFFYPEIQNFLDFQSKILYKIYNEERMPQIFNDKRKIGENDNILCEMIREDSIDDFIVYITKSNISLSISIYPSVFETNSFLLKNEEVSLIEYAAFFGSIQIFQYLKFNGIEMKPILWLYAIHGKNAEIIHLLEENEVKPSDTSFEECLKEALLCHHNDIATYIQDNCVENYHEDSSKKNFINAIIKFYNFAFIQSEFIDQSSFYDLCLYDYYNIVDILLRIKDIDVNEKHIL